MDNNSATRLLAAIGCENDRDRMRVAVSFAAQSLTYAQLDEEIGRVHALYVRLGLQRGQRIVLLLPSTLEFVLAYFAAHRAGLVVVPLNPLLGTQEVGEILRAMQPTLVVTAVSSVAPPAMQRLPSLVAACSPQSLVAFCGIAAAEAAQLLHGAISFDEHRRVAAPSGLTCTPRALHQEVVILYTSGTSGQPKGVSLSQAQILSNALQANRALGLVREDVILCPLPLAHVFGQLVIMLGALLAGAHLVLISRAAPQTVLDAMLEFQPTVLPAVPTTFVALARLGETDPPLARRAAQRLRLAFSGGATLPLAAQNHFETVFGHRIHQGYGMTEVACCIAVDDPQAPPSGGVGRLLPSLESRVEPLDRATPDRGQLHLRGPNLYRGYYLNGTFVERRAEEWFATGDIVQLRSTGELEIVDRQKDMIIRGGYNVYPSEVEQVLASHPGVLLVAVIGVPDPGLGQEVAAFVTLRDAARVTERELAEWCKERIALYKYPRRIAILTAMPSSPTGKILKRQLDASLLVRIDE